MTRTSYVKSAHASVIHLYTVTFEKYFTTSKNCVMADDQPGTWLCKLHANCISKSKTTGNQNTANEKVHFEDSKVKLFRKNLLLKHTFNQCFEG